MLLDTVYKQFIVMAVACLIVSPAMAQENVATTSNQVASSTATLSADGQLTGNVVAASTESNQTNQIPNAKVSLVSQGKVIDSVTTDSVGQFSFANVHPGPYQVIGIANGLVGSQALQVSPFNNAQPVAQGQIMLQQPAHSVYSSAPLSSYSTAPSASFSSGSAIGGGGGGRLFGGRIGGRLGRGLLSTPRGLLVVGGVAAGVAAIADSSPDQ